MRNIRFIQLLIAGVAAILILLAVQLLLPGETIQQAGPGGAQIAFSADRRMIAAPGTCVRVRWQVDHIRAVHLNGVAQVGQGFADVCDQNVAVLHVDFDDQTATDYSLEIPYLVEQPSTWLLVSAAILLSLAALYTAISRPVSAAAGQRAGASRMTGLFAGIGLAVMGILITLVLLELGLRFYFTHFGSELERIAYVYSRAQIDALTASTVDLPFVEYGLSPQYTDQNQLGYRGAEIQVEKPPGVYRIVALGGSTTYGTTTPADQSYPAYLQQVLRDQYGYDNVEVINGGVFGYTTWNIFVDLALRVTVLKPDLVIFYEGTNDVLPREVAPDCYSDPSPFLGLDPRREIRAAPGELSPLVLYRLVAIKLGWMDNPATVQGESTVSPLSCGGAGGTDPAQNVAANPPIYFERNERSMIAIAQADGFRMMFASWAYDHNSADALQFWRDAVAEHNAITQRVVQDEGELYFDYAAVAPGDDDSYWSDYVHMNAKGTLSQAQAFAQFLVDQGVIPTPAG